jgi:uncharacterized protein (DUF2461 family)
MLRRKAVAFHEGLIADNSKAYWTGLKHIYERAVQRPMRALLEELAPVFDAEPADEFAERGSLARESTVSPPRPPPI